MTTLLARDSAHRRFRLARKPEVGIQPCAPRVQRRDCHGRLAAALMGMVGEPSELEEASQRPWCSATFVGTQHRFVLCLRGEGAAERARSFAALLPEAEIPLVNHVVVDITVDALQLEEDGAARVTLAALTIEDW